MDENKGNGQRVDEHHEDGWQSVITGIGTIAYDKRLGSDFSVDQLTSEQIADRWRGDDIAARIIEEHPNEMLREGFDLLVQEDEVDDAQEGEPKEAQYDAKEVQEIIAGRWDDLLLDDALHQALCYERAYGGAGVLVGANDAQRDLSKPLAVERVQSVDWLTVLEPRELQPKTWYADPAGPKFGEPATYQLAAYTPGVAYRETAPSISTLTEIHESRLLIFPGIRVSRYQTLGSQSMSGWGESIFTRVESVLRDFNMGWSGASILLHDFAQAVFKMKGLSEIIATDNAEALKARIKAVELSRSVARAILIDADGEEFERKQTPISGMPEMLDRLATRLAAAAGMPVTLLMGQSPAGLNATGESDIRFFYDRIRALQSRKLRRPIEKLTRMLLYSMLGMEPSRWSIQFRPLWQPSDQERAGARKTQAETDAIYIGQSVLSPDEVARSRFGGDTYSYETQVDFAERDELDELARKAEEEKAAAAAQATAEAVLKAQAEAEAAKQAAAAEGGDQVPPPTEGDDPEKPPVPESETGEEPEPEPDKEQEDKSAPPSPDATPGEEEPESEDDEEPEPEDEEDEEE